ncbi:MAG: hypothetical protein HY390_02335 [Deltaproteobacteria bacterium]|nr:hypothetical protein [Deltaproteobacteria bacterium]
MPKHINTQNHFFSPALGIEIALSIVMHDDSLNSKENMVGVVTFIDNWVTNIVTVKVEIHEKANAKNTYF